MLRLLSCGPFPSNWGALLFHGLLFFHLSCTLPQIRICHAFTHVRAAADVADSVSGGLVMSRSFSDKQKARKGARFQFELLEPRHLFSVNPLAPSSPDTPPVESTSTAPLLGEQVDQALTNFTWLPLVYAGVDKVASVSTSLLLTGEIIINANVNLSQTWSKVSGPGNAVFGNASNVSSSVTFDQAGMYELQLTATNGGLTTFDRVFVTVAASNTINIDQAWLNAKGPGPYYLDQAGKTYVLQTDVTTKGTAFAITAKDITFDLNGHTITYDNAAPIVIPNGSFEQGSGPNATGWNFTNAPSASRHQGVWLYNETYEGDYSLKFSDTKTNQSVTSTTTITLEPNTTYSLSAMFELGGQGDYDNPGVKGYVRLIGANGEPTREVFWNQTNWRGIQHREGVFTTGATAETYTIQVGIEGHASSAKPFYIDDIKIQRTQTFGVAVSPKNWNPGATPDVTKYGDGTNATIKNGTITQGQGKATWGHGVYIYATNGVTIDGLTVTVQGANSSTLYGRDMTLWAATIANNTLTSNNRTITSRDSFNGSVMYGLSGTITGNTITNGPHAGIYTGGKIASNIANNTIQLKAKYTNAFAIIGNPSSTIHNNTILNGTGEYTSHGIGIVGGTEEAPGRVYNNTVEVQQLPGVNQEYQGIPTGGVFGLQFDNSPGTGVTGPIYSEVYGNNVTVYGTTNGYALRITVPGEAVLFIHHNTFRAVASGSGHAAPLSIYGEKPDQLGTFDADDLVFEDNTFITNDGIAIDSNGVPGLILRRTTFQVTTPIASPEPLTAGYYPGTGVHATLRFVDTVFADPNSRNYFESAAINFYNHNNGNVTPVNRMIVTEEWTATIQAKDSAGQPLSGASVSIKNKDNSVVYTGTTDANGKVTAVLKQQQMQGTTKTTYNNYTVTLSSGGNFQQSTLNADKSQVLVLQLSASQQSLNGMSGDGSLVFPLQGLQLQGLASFPNHENGADEVVLKADILESLQSVAPLTDPIPIPIAPMLTSVSQEVSVGLANTEAVDAVHAGITDFWRDATWSDHSLGGMPG